MLRSVIILLWIAVCTAVICLICLGLPRETPRVFPTYSKGSIVELMLTHERVQIVDTVCTPKECTYQVRLPAMNTEWLSEFELSGDTQ